MKMRVFCEVNIFKASREKDLFSCVKEKKLCILNGVGGNFYPSAPPG